MEEKGDAPTALLSGEVGTDAEAVEGAGEIWKPHSLAPSTSWPGLVDVCDVVGGDV